MEKYTKDENGLTPASMRSKRNAQARVEQYLLYIGNPNLALKEMDKDFCKGFIAFLKTCTFNNGKKTLGSTTCRIFVNRLAAALNMAVREGLIDSNPFKLLDAKEKPQKKSAMREFLTIEELRTLIATPCRYDIVKKTFLFSCMTGLRLGDMQHLRWSDIKDMNGVQMFSIIQHKTKRPVTVPLNTLALSLLPPRPENGEDGIIFPLVKKPDNVAKYVRRIKAKAGQHRVHAGLRKGEHGEESGGNEPDGRDVLMKNGKSEQRERGPYLIIPLCSFCGTDACLRWMKNVRD